ncbi:hypothetical protein SXCC_04262 [Gluconacetobacter sp. SXCC-1]|nr:hypothetical protein SXCC_04262 [Gluconacetobacter sp. SXCC-1]
MITDPRPIGYEVPNTLGTTSEQRILIGSHHEHQHYKWRLFLIPSQ